MKDIVFMINTEYHLLMSIGIMNRYFKEKYRITICQISPINGNRLKNLNYNDIPIRYKIIKYDYSNPNRILKKDINELIAIKPAVFFFFLENKFWMNYLFSKMHKAGTKIILGPDGMKTYNDIVVPCSTVIRKYISGILFCIKSGIFHAPFVERYYATSKYIDEVWVENMTRFHNRGKKKVFKFCLPNDYVFFSVINHVFCADECDFSILYGKSILYLDCPSSASGYYEKVIQLLERIQERHPSRSLAVKLHPRSSDTAKEVFRGLNNVTFLEPCYPAELYIANAKDSLIVSVISTSLLFYNPNCRYYWIFPLFKEMFDYSRIENPTDYINVVSSITEI